MQKEKELSSGTGIGKRIRLVRSAMKVTQQQIAEAMQVKPVKVSQYECGKCVPRQEQIEALCALCGVSTEWMLHGGSEEIVFIRPPVNERPRDRLIQMREEMRITQAALARMLGVNSSYISHLETGRIPITERFAERIEEKLGCGKYWILYGDISQKEYPLTREMLEYLRQNEKLRRRIWEKIGSLPEEREPGWRAGDRIRSRRKELGYTQQELAERIQITQASLSRIESGSVNASQKTIYALAEALNVSPGWILGEKGMEGR